MLFTDIHTCHYSVHTRSELDSLLQFVMFMFDSLILPYLPSHPSLQQITALKKENFNLKLRIYFMEDRMQQKCDDSTEDIFKTVITFMI